MQELEARKLSIISKFRGVFRPWITFPNARVILPMGDRCMPYSRTAAITPPTKSPQKVRGLVLVVEDEPSLRTLLRRMLEIYGFASREAASAEEAIAVAQSAEMPFDAMLTDLQLPEMTGLELAAKVQALRPGLPVVFMSGYPRDTAFGFSAHQHRGSEFLQKPFSPPQLGEVMRRVLQSRNPSAADDTKEIPSLPPMP